ncbi:PKD domain-containing protein [Patescibacteria group bacterium]|nr:PKD domain-containing protein [Patescibacteria group bacterium]
MLKFFHLKTQLASVVIFISIFLIVAIVVFFGIGQKITIVQAGLEDNVVGFAWSENIGWISFNNLSDGSAVNYGVNVDVSNGNFSGYAWSEHIGWISFNESDTGVPPSNDPCPGSSCIAKAVPSNQLGRSNVNINGWARALSYGGGWDGWIRFDHGQANPAYIGADGDWHGWAWGSDVVGWISFNGADAAAGGNYKVIIDVQSPIVSDLSVSVGDSTTYCGNAAHYFSWNYYDPSGDDEERFQFQVDNNSDFSSLEVDRDFGGLSNPSPTTNNQTVTVAETPVAGQLGYSTTYYWRVKVYDSEGNDSGWVVGPSFATEPHRYPSINFNWLPTEPSVEEDVLFSDQSVVYGGASKSSWSWTFENGNPGSSSAQDPTIQFTTTGEKDVVLRVTDSDGYTCSKTQTIGVQESLPDWKEIIPW